MSRQSSRSSSRRMSNGRSIPSILSRKRKRDDEMEQDCPGAAEKPSTSGEAGPSGSGPAARRGRGDPTDEPVASCSRASTSSAVPSFSKVISCDEVCFGDDSSCSSRSPRCSSPRSQSSLSPEKTRDMEAELREALAAWERMRSRVRSKENRVDRRLPLPQLRWVDSDDLWQNMCQREQQYLKGRDANLFFRHPELQPRMRSILLDWLTEVCEVYRMHRQTYQRALDYLDRFLSVWEDLPKQRLQLMGITCLFMAAKIEEIYPPKVSDFAYVTDGACSEQEILSEELVVMKALRWELEPVTVHEWLSLYLQIMSKDGEEAWVEESEEDEDEGKEEKKKKRLRDDDWFLVPSYNVPLYLQATQLADFCQMDEGSLQFPYSVLGAAAVYYCCGRQMALMVSGYTWIDISACVQWMAPFATTFRRYCPTQVKSFPQLPPEEVPLIQTHAFELELLTLAQECAAESMLVTSGVGSSPMVMVAPGLLTPPSSSHKGEQIPSAQKEVAAAKGGPSSFLPPTPPPISWTCGLPIFMQPSVESSPFVTAPCSPQKSLDLDMGLPLDLDLGLIGKPGVG